MKSRYFDIAKKMSKFSDHPQHKIGACIIYKSRIVSMGFNRMRTNPNSTTYNQHTHCELDCVLRADRDKLKGATIYIYRENRHGVPSNSKPCPFCHELLKKVKIKTVIYSYDGGFVKENI